MELSRTGKLKAAVVALATLTGGSAVHADTGDAYARLAFSDKLSMYSQRIAASACEFTAETSPFESRGFLATAGHEVNRILKALAYGDRALGISSAEQNDNIKDLLAEIDAQWDPAYKASMGILDGAAATADLAANNAEFAHLAARLSGAISNTYTDGDSLQLSDAIRLQVAGRQRMLAQQLALHSCTLHAGDASARAELSQTYQLFDMAAQALRRGMPEVGLIPTADPVLIKALDEVDQHWGQIKWPLVSLIGGSELDARSRGQLYLDLQELTHAMDKAVVAYTKAARESQTAGL